MRRFSLAFLAAPLHDSLVARPVPGQGEAVEERVEEAGQRGGDVGVHEGRFTHLYAGLLKRQHQLPRELKIEIVSCQLINIALSMIFC